MLKYTIVRTVEYCTRYPWAVVLVSLLLTVASCYYAATHFALNTDVNKLIAQDLDWRQREIAFEKLFPGRHDSILIVVDAPIPELAAQAADALTKKLEEQPQLFPKIRQLNGGPFFDRNGLLFLPTSELEEAAKGLTQAEPLISALASDPSLRGITGGLSLALAGVQRGQLGLDDMARVLNVSAETLENVLANRPASFSWQALLRGKPPEPGDLRRLIEVHPKLDFAALEPGGAAAGAIRQAARDLNFGEAYRARVRLTGPVPIADEEFASVKEGAVTHTIGTVLIVLTILWISLRSAKIIGAVAINLFVGLAMTAAVGFMLVDALNLISVAFAVLFIGIGVDFGIQFAVRYRAERHENRDLHQALRSTADSIGLPLTLAATATAIGFLSFLPTDYRGVSELGQIAGVGMMIAFFTSITLLPALLQIFNPKGEPEPVGYRALAPVDRFLERHRVAVVGGTLGVAILGAPLLYFLEFDFNPMNLRSPKVESMSTFYDLKRDSDVGIDAINVMAANVEEAEKVAERMRQIPQVGKASTVRVYIPEDQDRKLALIKDLDKALTEALGAPEDPPPTDEENVTALRETVEVIEKASAGKQGQGAVAAKRLGAALIKLADADAAARERATHAFVPTLRTTLDQLRGYLKAEPISLETLPQELLGDWVTEGGRARAQAIPKGDSEDNEVQRAFARAMTQAFPSAVGGPIAILESGRTIVRAFIEAGFWALVVIALLLWTILKRFGDVLLTLVPLIIAGVITLELCVLIGLPLNFANIIAVPLLLGIGVAFKIYYIMAWRAGQTDLLQSSLTRAVIGSALATAVAFGSLWLSSHPGTSSMGKLLALSLVTTLCAAVLFQPALMGKPREDAKAP